MSNLKETVKILNAIEELLEKLEEQKVLEHLELYSTKYGVIIPTTMKDKNTVISIVDKHFKN